MFRTHVPRVLLGLTLAMALSAAACGSDDPAPAPAPAVAPAEAIIGTWTNGARRMVLRRNRTFVWHQVRRCGRPPCPMVARTGTYELQGSTLVLHTAKGRTFQIRFLMRPNPRAMDLDAPAFKARWNLRWVGPPQ